MKSIITLCLSCLICLGTAHAQTVIYSQNFNSGSASDWSLNTSDLGGDASMSGNIWVINNTYAAGPLGTATPTEPASITGAPSSYYMHMNCGASFSGFYGSNDNFLALSSGATYFAAQNTPISTSGMTNVYFSFWWICEGDATSIGNVYYRTSAGGTWIQITTPITDFYGSSSWQVDSFHIAAFDNQAFLEFGFQFTDGVSGAGSDPAFGIDDITVTGVGSGSAPVASITAASVTTCQDSCLTFTSTSTGTIDSFRWRTTPGGTTIGTPTSTSTSICFPNAGTTRVHLYVYNSAGMDSTFKDVAVTPTPSPTITQTGNVLSVPALYTGYQWYNGLSPIAGATTNSYTITATSTYGVVVDSAGCPGVAIITGTLHIINVNDLTDHYWVAQPNNSSVTVNSSKPLNDVLAITVYDATGRKIVNDIWNAGSLTKQINGLTVANGLYIIKISNNYTSTILKWQKQ